MVHSWLFNGSTMEFPWKHYVPWKYHGSVCTMQASWESMEVSWKHNESPMETPWKHHGSPGKSYGSTVEAAYTSMHAPRDGHGSTMGDASMEAPWPPWLLNAPMEAPWKHY